MTSSIYNLLRPFLLFSLLLICVFFSARLGLVFWQFDRFSDSQAITTLLFNGMRIDLSTIGYLLIIPALFHPWVMLVAKNTQWWSKTLTFVFYVILISILFFELATPAFINEYGFRPNRLFIEYLAYPNEVFKMLIHGHLLTLVVVLLSLILPYKLLLKTIRKITSTPVNKQTVTASASLATFIILLATLALSARGTIGHRPINPALVYFSTDPLVNSLTLNSIYSVAHAYKQLGNEKNATKMYGSMGKDKLINIIQTDTGIPLQLFNSPQHPSLSKREPGYQGKPKNLVIILEESLGAQFVASLGGLNLTPQLDKLSNEGWAFKNLFATGTRSVRGIEAVITGFTPTPARAVVKLDKSQRNFFTIASLLKANHYKTQFIYGGESHFDNMKSFFLGNGFTDIVDFNNIKNPEFVGSWGASDGDLFTQADKELVNLHNANTPFFSFIFTSSNHDPFEIPENVIKPIKYSQAQLAQFDDKERSRHKAVQYADYALGEFIKKAKKQAYWKDTIFLIVADHDARALGSELVPVTNFRIPGVILNSGKPEKIDERIVSQIDLAPTLLSLMGIENYSPMIGQDLTKKKSGGRAMMQYADNFAYLKENEMVILQPQKSPLTFNYDLTNKKLTPSKNNKALAEKALAHAIWGSLAYENDWYSLPTTLISN
ncbi:LTA synthase family protein [Thalassotalea piscium]